MATKLEKPLLQWKAPVSGEAALATALNASLAP
jgi:hypothetical protein